MAALLAELGEAAVGVAELGFDVAVLAADGEQEGGGEGAGEDGRGGKGDGYSRLRLRHQTFLMIHLSPGRLSPPTSVRTARRKSSSAARSSARLADADVGLLPLFRSGGRDLVQPVP